MCAQVESGEKQLQELQQRVDRVEDELRQARAAALPATNADLESKLSNLESQQRASERKLQVGPSLNPGGLEAPTLFICGRLE
jgi:chromosome segregation ATPase